MEIPWWSLAASRDQQGMTQRRPTMDTDLILKLHPGHSMAADAGNAQN